MRAVDRRNPNYRAPLLFEAKTPAAHKGAQSNLDSPFPRNPLPHYRLCSQILESHSNSNGLHNKTAQTTFQLDRIDNLTSNQLPIVSGQARN